MICLSWLSEPSVPFFCPVSTCCFVSVTSGITGLLLWSCFMLLDVLRIEYRNSVDSEKRVASQLPAETPVILHDSVVWKCTSSQNLEFHDIRLSLLHEASYKVKPTSKERSARQCTVNRLKTRTHQMRTYSAPACSKLLPSPQAAPFLGTRRY